MKVYIYDSVVEVESDRRGQGTILGGRGSSSDLTDMLWKMSQRFQVFMSCHFQSPAQQTLPIKRLLGHFDRHSCQKHTKMDFLTSLKSSVENLVKIYKLFKSHIYLINPSHTVQPWTDKH